MKRTDRTATEKPDNRYNTNPLVAMALCDCLIQSVYGYEIHAAGASLCFPSQFFGYVTLSCYINGSTVKSNPKVINARTKIYDERERGDFCDESCDGRRTCTDRKDIYAKKIVIFIW